MHRACEFTASPQGPFCRRTHEPVTKLVFPRKATALMLVRPLAACLHRFLLGLLLQEGFEKLQQVHVLQILRTLAVATRAAAHEAHATDQRDVTHQEITAEETAGVVNIGAGDFLAGLYVLESAQTL